MEGAQRQPTGAAWLLAALVLATSMAPALSIRPPPAQAAAGASFVGPARVVDGDTLAIGQERFRLYGVDAPEKAQNCVNATGQSYGCGLVSKDALTQKVGNQTVECKVKNSDQYGRNVAVCSLPGAEDLNKWLVDNGYAVAYREYGKDYVAAEEVAKAARRGIWAGTFTYPAQWRKDQKAGVPNTPLPPLAYAPPPSPSPAPPKPVRAPPAPPPEVCGKGVLPIKGNINGKGDKIYHTPGGAYYDSVLVEPEKGEQYFCNEADAVKAGYRPVRTTG